MPFDRRRYPSDWDAIALEVKAQSGWRCVQCNRLCRVKGETIEEFAMIWGEDGAAEVRAHPQRFTLTVAHYPDHNPMNCARENLRALCAPCHLRLIARRRGAYR